MQTQFDSMRNRRSPCRSTHRFAVTSGVPGTGSTGTRLQFSTVNLEQTIDAAVAVGKAGRVEEAEAMLRRVIAAEPSHARAYSNLATALYLQKRFEESLSAAD